MIAMDDIKVEFNGIDLTSYGIWSVSVDGQKPHIFAGSKTISTARPIYNTRNVVTGMNYEPLSFSLTLAPHDNEWTEQYVNEIYKLFDVRTYKPLRFGDDEMYYNVLPYVGSTSEMMLFAQAKGYVTIPFVCDAGHGWIDREYHYERLHAGRDQAPKITNPCNILTFDNTYKVYPYIVIDNIQTSDLSDDAKSTFVSFGLASEIDQYPDNEPKQHWFNLYNFPVTSEIHIDGANQQIYDITNNINVLEYIKDNSLKKNVIWFPYLLEGENVIYTRFLDDISVTSTYDLHFYLTCPYMK